jgi:hypothetical protein
VTDRYAGQGTNGAIVSQFELFRTVQRSIRL